MLKRTVAHLPGVHCIPKETWVWSTRMPGPEGYVQVERKVEAVRAKLEEWDGEAAAGGFRAW